MSQEWKQADSLSSSLKRPIYVRLYKNGKEDGYCCQLLDVSGEVSLRQSKMMSGKQLIEAFSKQNGDCQVTSSPDQLWEELGKMPVSDDSGGVEEVKLYDAVDCCEFTFHPLPSFNLSSLILPFTETIAKQIEREQRLKQMIQNRDIEIEEWNKQYGQQGGLRHYPRKRCQRFDEEEFDMMNEKNNNNNSATMDNSDTLQKVQLVTAGLINLILTN